MWIWFFAVPMAYYIYKKINEKRREAQREDFIRTFKLPRGLLRRVQKKHPQLNPEQLERVSLGLRQFFLAYLKSGLRPVSMPSQVVDDLWHEFILYTQAYQSFCQQAFGQFLHHSPVEVISSQQESNQSLRRTWFQCCAIDYINPKAPARLPLLFALDSQLAIIGGFIYLADCAALRSQSADGSSGIILHCGTDFSDPGLFGSGGCAGSGGSGCSSGDSGGCSGGCGGGCGGD